MPEAPKTTSPTWDENILQGMRDYYKNYYHDLLGIPNWQERVENRLTEEINILPQIRQVERWSNTPFAKGDKVLIVGGGTGAEFIALHDLGCEVYAVEPEAAAVTIGRQKAVARGIPETRFVKAAGENLPFADGEFDWVWCYTVLEHVRDVEACVKEIVRVMKPRGRAFIETPDYRQFYEPHYKLYIPMFLPKWLIAIWLRLRGRDPAFLQSLQFVTSTWLMRLFQNCPVDAMWIFQPWPEQWKTRLSLPMRLIKWRIQRHGIQRDQMWLLRKLGDAEWR